MLLMGMQHQASRIAWEAVYDLFRASSTASIRDGPNRCSASPRLCDLPKQSGASAGFRCDPYHPAANSLRSAEIAPIYKEIGTSKIQTLCHSGPPLVALLALISMRMDANDYLNLRCRFMARC